MPATVAEPRAPLGAPPIKAMLVMALPAIAGLGFGANFPLRGVTVDARVGAGIGVGGAEGPVVFVPVSEPEL